MDVLPFNSKRPFLVGALCRPPLSNVDVDTKVEKNIDRERLYTKCEIILMGDSNVNYFDNAQNSHRLAKALKTMTLSQIVTSVTRPKSGTC